MPMSDLKQICEQLGFEDVKTYIASGNVVFRSDLSQSKVKAALEKRVEEYFGSHVPIMIRSIKQLKIILENNPFADQPPSRVIVSFLNKTPRKELLQDARHQSNELAAAGKKEIYVFYPEGQGRSKFVLPAANEGTGRNINTVTKLISLAEAL